MPAANLPFEVRSSALHGKGLFARRAIAADEVIGEAEGRIVNTNGMHVLWIHDEERDVVEGLEITNELRFVNHDNNANADFDGEVLVALRKIPRGEEITFDYGTKLVSDDEEPQTSESRSLA